MHKSESTKLFPQRIHSLALFLSGSRATKHYLFFYFYLFYQIKMPNFDALSVKTRADEIVHKDKSKVEGKLFINST